MVADAVILGSLGLMVVILASVLGAVTRRERFPFVAGIALFILAHVVAVEPAAVGMALAALGILLAAGSTIPLLRQPA